MNTRKRGAKTLPLGTSKRPKLLQTSFKNVLERAKQELDLPDVLFAIVKAYFGFCYEQVVSSAPFGGSPATMMAQAPDAWAYIAWYDHINLCDETGAFTLQGHTDLVKAIVSVPPFQDVNFGFDFASASVDTTVRLWNSKTRECVQVLKGHTQAVVSLAVSKDKLASVGRDHTVRVWDLLTFQHRVFQGHKDQVVSVAWVHGGLLASGSWDTTIKVWRPLEVHHEPLHTLTGHTGWVWCLTALHGGKLASGSTDQTVRVWDLNTQACLFVFKEASRSIFSMAMLPEGLLVYASDKLYVRDVESTECRVLNERIADTDTDMKCVTAMCADATGLTTYHGDRTIKRWE